MGRCGTTSWPTRNVLFRTVPAFCAPLIGSSSDRRAATLPNGARAVNLAVTQASSGAGPAPRSRAAKLFGSPGPWQEQTSSRRTRTGTSPNRERNVARSWPLLASGRSQAAHQRRRSPTTATCAETILAWSAAVSCFASSSRSPRSARPASSLRSRHATSVSVVTPGSSSATNFTRHTSFGTSPPSFREPEAYLDRKPAPTGLHALLDIDREMYKWRHLIENFFCKLKEFKRIALRADKTDQSFAAMIYIAAALINSR